MTTPRGLEVRGYDCSDKSHPGHKYQVGCEIDRACVRLSDVRAERAETAKLLREAADNTMTHHDALRRRLRAHADELERA